MLSTIATVTVVLSISLLKRLSLSEYRYYSSSIISALKLTSTSCVDPITFSFYRPYSGVTAKFTMQTCLDLVLKLHFIYEYLPSEVFDSLKSPTVEILPLMVFCDEDIQKLLDQKLVNLQFLRALKKFKNSQQTTSDESQLEVAESFVSYLQDSRNFKKFVSECRKLSVLVVEGEFTG